MPDQSALPLYRVALLALVVLLAVSLGCGLWALAVSYQRAFIPHSVDYEEGNVLNAAVRINQGLTPYPDPHSWPVILNPYGPVPYYAIAVPVRIWGPAFAPARMVMVIATVIGAVFIAVILWYLTRSPLVAATFGTMYVSFLLIQHWMPVLRVDLLGITIVLAGLYVFIAKPEWWWLAAALFVIALFTKYSLLAAPAACFVYLLAQREWKRAAQFGGLGLLLSLLWFAGMEWSTHGAFAFDMFRTHPDAYRIDHYTRLLAELVLCDLVLVLLALAAFVRAAIMKRMDVLTWYLLFGLLASLTGGKIGSNENHMLELAAIFCLNAGVTWKWLLDGGVARQALAAISALVMVVILFGKTGLMAPSAPRPGCIAAYRVVRGVPTQHILSEDVGALVTQGKPVEISNPFVYSQLAMAGKLSDEELQYRLEQHYFGLIILSQGGQEERWSPAVRNAIHENYEQAAAFSCPLAAEAYVPKQ